MLADILTWPGPVVWWHPTGGQRHAFHPDPKPAPGQHRHALCGDEATLAPATYTDWLAPTCDICMARARDRAHAREKRRS